MSESTDLYYDRLASVATNAMTTAPEDAHPINIMTHAVAAQVLRDVLDHMDRRFVVVGIDERDGNVRTAIDAIEAFAAERGIDLEDTP